MKDLTSPVWNSLFYGKERKIVQKISQVDGYNLWIAVYDMPKNKSPLLPDFLRNATTRFCIIVFKYKAETDLLEQGFDEKHFYQQNLNYVNNVEEISEVLKMLNINPEQFEYPWKIDFPMGT